MLPETINICTYNVLSSSLSAPSFFHHCNPDDAKAENRYERLLEKLSVVLRNDYIITLQEVSVLWESRLIVWFSQRGYTYIGRGYGNKFNGYMGVAIAFPSSKYGLVDCSIVNVADQKPGGYEDKDKQPSALLNSLAVRVWGALSLFVTKIGSILFPRFFIAEDEKQSDSAAWAAARSRSNMMIMLSLRIKPIFQTGSASIVVATYHMPCYFFMPNVMMIHTALVKKCLADFVQKNYGQFVPRIFLTGDFNFTPESEMFALMTRDVVPKLCPGPAYDGDKFQFQSGTKFASLFAISEHGEPAYTNVNWSGKSEKPFRDTLDYIFVNYIYPKITCCLVPEITDDSLPNKDEPSDHLMLAAEVLDTDTSILNSLVE
jgi:hypothetical protein